MKIKWLLMVVLMSVMVAGLRGDLQALGPAPYPKGPVSFEKYAHDASGVRMGEELLYQFHWNGINAARAVWKVFPDPAQPSQICARAEGEIIGSPALLYRAKDWVESCLHPVTLEPSYYQIQIRETLSSYDMRVQYDREARKAHMSYQSRVRTKEEDFEFQHVNSPVSLAFLLRSLPWKPGDERRFEVVDGNGRYLLVFTAVEEREVSVPAGTFSAVRLQPSIFKLRPEVGKEGPGWWERQKRKDKDRLNLMRSFEFWMMKDPPRYFLCGRTDVYFGHVNFELKEIISAGK